MTASNGGQMNTGIEMRERVEDRFTTRCGVARHGHVHRVRNPAQAWQDSHFGESEWKRKGLGQWCWRRECLGG